MFCLCLQVVYDISKGESELDLLMPWLLNIQARAPSSPVIIIGTHIDKVPKGGLIYDPFCNACSMSALTFL